MDRNVRDRTLEGEADLAEMAALGDRRDGRRHLIESVALLVDRRLDAVELDGADHILEHVAAAERHALKPHVPRHDASQIELRHAAREDADHGERAAGADGAKRLIERLGAAELDDEIGAAAVERLAQIAAPFRMRAI